MKPNEEDSVTKNSAELTVPITFFAGISVLNKLLVVIGPQPPPPIASKNDAIKPINLIQILFSKKELLIFRKDLNIIIPHIIIK